MPSEFCDIRLALLPMFFLTFFVGKTSTFFVHLWFNYTVLQLLKNQIRMMLPRDLQEGVLEAISLEALGQVLYCLDLFAMP